MSLPFSNLRLIRVVLALMFVVVEQLPISAQSMPVEQISLSEIKSAFVKFYKTIYIGQNIGQIKSVASGRVEDGEIGEIIVWMSLVNSSSTLRAVLHREAGKFVLKSAVLLESGISPETVPSVQRSINESGKVHFKRLMSVSRSRKPNVAKGDLEVVTGSCDAGFLSGSGEHVELLYGDGGRYLVESSHRVVF